MPNYRRQRVNDEVTRVISDILRTVKDPRIGNALITITQSDVTPDLKFAKIYFSMLGTADIKEVKKGLASATGYIRHQIAQSLDLRMTPELIFEYDDAPSRGARISELIKMTKSENTGEDIGGNE